MSEDGFTSSAGPRLVWDRKSTFTAEDYDDANPSTKAWLIKNAWPMRGVVFVAGASGAAKTFFALDGLLKVAGGADKVWGRRAQQGGVIYNAGEDPEGCRSRMRAWRRTKGSRAAEAGRRLPFKLVPQVVNLLDEESIEDFTTHAQLIAADMLIDGTTLRVICFDTFSVSIPGADENNGADMSRALGALYRLSEALDVLIVVVAHFGKSGTTGGIRGWSGLSYNADGVIIIERDEDDADLRHVTFQKVKNGPGGGGLDFTLKEVDLDMFDDMGEPMTSCIVEYHAPAQTASRRKKLGPADKPGPKIVLRAMSQCLELGPTFVIPPIPGVPPNTVGVERTRLRERAMSLGHPSAELKPETAKRMINKDIADLIADGRLREEDGYIWRVR